MLRDCRQALSSQCTVRLELICAMDRQESSATEQPPVPETAGMAKHNFKSNQQIENPLAKLNA